MNYPMRQQTPNGWQVAGQALQGAGEAVGQFSDKQAQMRALFQQMVEKRQAAILAQKQQEQEMELKRAEDARQEAEAGRKSAAEENRKKFQEGIQGKVISATLAKDPSLAKSSKPVVPGGPTQAELDDLGDVQGMQMPNQDINAQDSTQMMGAALDRQPVDMGDGRTELNRDEVMRLGMETGQMTPAEYASATKPVREPMTREDALELYKAKKEIDAAIAGNKPLSPYQEMMMEVYKDRIEQGKAGREERKAQAETGRKTAFVKNTNELKTEIDMFGKLDKSVPGGIYGTGGISGFGFGTAPLRKFWKTEEANTIRPTLQFLVNAILKRQSGAAVSEQEFDRLNTAFGINTTGTIEEFRQGLQNYYESAQNQYDRFVKADSGSAAAIDAPTQNLNPAAKPAPQTGGSEIRLTGDKAKRLAELRAKAAQGTLK